MDALRLVYRQSFAVVLVFTWAWSSTFANDYEVCATYTTNQDFAQGALINLNGTGDELRINTTQQTLSADPEVLPWIWVACSYRGTVVRIATAHYFEADDREVNIGDVLGEYRTAPDGCGDAAQNGFPGDPSRTTVDFDGSVWVANRSDLPFGDEELDPHGHVVKIGNGLAFQWVDRNCNGVLDTSTGLGDVRPWPNQDNPPKCTSDDVRFAQDELILLYQPVPAHGTRTVAVDRETTSGLAGEGEFTRVFERTARESVV